MKKLLQISAFALLGSMVLTGFSGCRKPTTMYPAAPQIELVDAYAEKDEDGDYIYVITFNFTDGDGDLGIIGDNPDTFNVHTVYMEKIGGSFRQVTMTPGATDTVRGPTSYFPDLTPEGRAKAIKGIIVARLFLGPWNPEPHRSNTTRLTLWINDRAGHMSNKIETPEIVLN